MTREDVVVGGLAVSLTDREQEDVELAALDWWLAHRPDPEATVRCAARDALATVYATPVAPVWIGDGLREHAIVAALYGRTTPTTRAQHRKDRGLRPSFVPLLPGVAVRVRCRRCGGIEATLDGGEVWAVVRRAARRDVILDLRRVGTGIPLDHALRYARTGRPGPR